jgi:protein-tyrosine phosphatase
MGHENARVLFVCMGNICRSPTGEGVFQKVVADRGLQQRVEIDSAGTISHHAGDRADPRMRTAAAQRGYPLTSRARQIVETDIVEFDLIIAMDRENLRDIRKLVARGQSSKHIKLLSEFLPKGSPADVPDPYYGGPSGFDCVIDMIEGACPHILEYVLEETRDGSGQV